MFRHTLSSENSIRSEIREPTTILEKKKKAITINHKKSTNIADM